MAFDFKKIPDQIVDVAFEYEGQTLNCKLNLNKLTQAKLNEFEKTPNEYAMFLATIVTEWDAEGLNYPDYDFLRTLPVTFLAKLFGKCMEATGPKVQTAAA